LVQPPTGTVTFLFTDIEGSTRLWEERPEEMRAALAEHDGIVRGAIETHGGYVFSTGGDGFAAAFARASDAVNAAAEAQVGLAGHPTIRVRMGVHTGEAQERDGDYFGPPVNRAARIMAAGHGGQVLVSAATAELVTDIELHDLGEHRLRDLSRPEHVWQIGAGEFTALRTLDTARTNLPTQLTSFVGREREAEELVELLASNRMITLCGVGGVGKTRLALHAAADLVGSVRGGVWLVELAPARSGDDVIAALATVWELQPRNDTTLHDAVIEAARARRCLLVFDNCEHVIDAVAELVELLLRYGSITVLATSREPLGVEGERVVRVRSLAPETAVRLFVERASSTRDDFAPSPSDLSTIESICTRLDGVPLAIELAAARVRALTVDDIAARLDQRFRLLTGGRRTAVERHQTLRAAVEWSYSLLTDEEQRSLARLSVFSGGFGLDAATQLLSADIVSEPGDVVTDLVDKSLVMAQYGEGASRYALLETIRQFAAEKLESSGLSDEVRHAHAQWVRSFVEATCLSLRGPEAPLGEAALATDFDNLRSAVEWCLDTGDGELAASLLTPLRPSSLWESGLEYRVGALATRVEPFTNDPAVIALAAYGANHHGDLELTEALCERAAALLRATPGAAEPTVRYVQATLELHRWHFAESEQRSWQRVEAARALRDPYEEANAIATIVVARHIGSLESPPELVAHSVALARQVGAPRLLVLTLMAQAMQLIRESSSKAPELIDEALRYATGWYTTGWLRTLAIVASPATPDLLARSLRDVIRVLDEEGSGVYVTYALWWTALALAHYGQRESAATLWGHVPRVISWLDFRGVDTADEYTDARARGATMTTGEAIALAIRELDELVA
jgi:predicted ATPase/class 3 adenylate cyclase